MGYTKNTWKKDDIITEDRLNAMETGIDGIYNPINLDAGYDFNNLQTAGYYMASGIFPNSPTPTISYSYYIEVYTNHQGFITQKVTQYSSAGTNVYVRSFFSSWQPWQQLATDTNAVHKTGNETVAGDKFFTGKTTIASKEMTDTGWLDIPLNSGVTANRAKYRILFGVVYIHIKEIKGKSSYESYLTLPDGIRPPDTIFKTWFWDGNFGNNKLETGGEFMCISGRSDASTQVSFDTQYPI